MLRSIFVTLSLLAGLSLNLQSQELVAPQPPEAVEVKDFPSRSITGGGSEMFTRVFFTPLSVDDAVAYYSNNAGDLQVVENGKEYRANLIDLEIKQLGVLKVYDLPRNPGITVKCVRTLERERCSSDYFNHFRDMASALDQYSRDDFNDLCKQYGYLELGYYGYSDKKDSHGNQLTNDEVLYREYFKELSPELGKAMLADEMAAEAQRLIQQGRMDEATELLQKAAELQTEAYQSMTSQDMQQLQQGKREVDDNWDEWMEYLKELDGMILPTVVFINTHPSEWTQDEWIHESIEW